MDLPYIALLQNSLSLHLALPSFLTPILFSCGVIPDIIHTFANGVAEGLALHKGGWDCFFYLASILKCVTRKLVLEAWRLWVGRLPIEAE